MAAWDIRQMLQTIRKEQLRQGQLLDSIKAEIDQLVDVLIIDNVPTDLELKIAPVTTSSLKGDSSMAQKTKVKMLAKGQKAHAVMAPVKWSTLAGGIQFVPVDANGQPITTIDPTVVASTLVANDTNTPPGVSTLATVAAGADSLHYTISRTLATGNIVLNATLTWNDGSFGPFTASLPIELDAVPPGAPTDLQLVISGN